MPFPSKEQIEKMLKKLENVEPSNVIDYENSSKSIILKGKLCREFVRYMNDEKITQAELARRLDLDRSIVNRIVKYQIEKFTSDYLVDQLSKIKNGKIKISI